MDFNGGPPAFFSNNINTLEGCASVCDANGNLLFYAAPNKVWARNDVVMPNGSGLSGSTSNTQGALIVQSYNNPNQYYLFTVNSDVFYSVIDMTLNGGYGDVIVGQKNILLDSNMYEKMIAIRGNGCYQWLVVHSKSDPVFHAFKIDATGISTTPVISNSGFVTGTDPYHFGEMKVSPDDSTIALVNGSLVNTTDVELHSFNNTTGQVFNGIDLDTMYAYGVSFSPDGTKLYTSQNISNHIYQYDLSLLPDVLAVKNSRTSIANVYCHGMRIGPDGKLYLIQGVSVYVINDPNAAGLACNYNATPVFAINNGMTLGNDFVPNVFNRTVVHDTTVCLVDSFFVLAPTGYDSYLWSDGSTMNSDTFSAAGTKWVISTVSCGIAVDTFHISADTVVNTTNVVDTTMCLVNDTVIFSATAGYTSYAWSDGNVTQTDTITVPGTKWVVCKTDGCNKNTDTFHVHDWRDTTKLAMDTSHCIAYSPIPVTAPGGYTSYTWSDGHIGQTDTFFSSITKWVTAINGCNMLIDTVHFTATTIPQDSVSMYGGDTTLCFDNIASVNVDGPPGYTFYLWNDGITAQTNSFSGPGIKWVYAQKLCYLLIDTFSVSALPTDTTTSVTDTMICFSNAISLDATAGYDTYLWSDGISTQSDTFSQSGIKSVNAHKACAERIDSFDVIFINDLSVNLGPDTSICKGETLQLDATSSNYPEAQYLWQDGKTTAVYNVTEDGDYSVSVNVGPCTVSDTVKVHQKVINIDLGKGLIPCHGESLRLDAGVDSASYLWQDGSTGRTYTATKAGSYSVTVTQGNCSATASVMVKYEGCPCHVLIPTAFSPNNDSRNDQFGVTLSCDIQSFKLMIYNRWGNQVFYSEDVNEKWDGTSKGIMLDGDVFNYYAEFKDGEGKMYYYKGTVTLVR